MGEEAVVKVVYWSRLRWKTGTLLLFLTCFESFLSWVESASEDPKNGVDEHLRVGMSLLGRGQYSDALTHFHSAIDADPNNYLSYYKRANVFLALSRSRPALVDLNKVLELKSDFSAARLQRGNTLFKMGRLDEAHIDLERLLATEPDNTEASKIYSQIDSLQTRIKMVHDLVGYQNYQGVIDELSEIIELIPWDASLRELRSNAYIYIGNKIHAISDLRSVTKLTSDNTGGFMKLSELHYQLGETEESLKEVRECLKLDPEHKDCYPFYKKVKKVGKFVLASREALESKDWEECVYAAEKVLKNEPKVMNVRFIAHENKCKCLLENGEAKESQKACSQALKIKEEPRLYCDRAEAYLLEDLYDEAMGDYRRALEIEEGLQRAKEGLQRAQQRQKQAGKRDYYKILGLKRTASKKEVAKVYRKLALKWHPDNFQDEVEKKKAEKKFMDIAAAKEVLTDDEKRRKFDNGEDPLDPEAQRQDGFHHQGHPFPQGRQFHFHDDHFDGGGFKFHFN